MDIDKLLKQNNDLVNKTVKRLYSYQQGTLQPIPTSFDHLNNMLHGGLFPGMVISIVARSGQGKTYTAHTLKEDILNCGKDVGILIFNWEMTLFNLMLVEIRKRTGMKYSEILNLKSPTPQQKKILKDVADSFRNEKLTTVSQSLTGKEYKEACTQYIKQNFNKEQLVIITDHLGVAKGSDKLSVLTEICEVQNEIKLAFPGKVTFINLAQLNRSADALFRNPDTNPLQLRLSPSMIYNADAMMQYSDLILGQIIPDKFNMESFTAVHKVKYDHLSDHFSDKSHKGDYAILKSENRIFFDYIKPRLEDGQPTLYGQIMDEQKEELVHIEKTTEKPELDF